MNQESLLFGLAAVLGGLATVEFVLGFVYTPALFAVALPFAAAAYFVWYQASGRLRERIEQGRASAYQRAGQDPETGGFGAGPRESFSGRRGGFDDGGRNFDPRERAGFGSRGRGGFGGERRAGFGAREGRRAAGRGPGAGTGTGGARRVRRNAGPSPAEAYRVLGLDPGADADAVRRAYREKVKSVHPDREGGDEEAFKRVNEAYEVLTDRD